VIIYYIVKKKEIIRANKKLKPPKIKKEDIFTEAELNARDEKGMTKLHTNSEMGNIEIVETLISQHSQINTIDSSGWTPLLCACQGGFLNVVEVLLDAGADPNLSNKQGTTIMHYLVREKMSNELRWILEFLTIEKRVDWNSRTKFGETPLHHAAQRLNYKLVAFLLKNGANVNAQTISGETALHKVSALGTAGIEMMKLLIQNGADASIKSNFGKPCEIAHNNEFTTTLLCAAEQSSELLTTFWSSPSSRDNLGRSPLLRAVQQELIYVIKYFLKTPHISKCDVNNEGENALHLAASQGNLIILADLINAGFAWDQQKF